jgi:hypothetical protein
MHQDRATSPEVRREREMPVWVVKAVTAVRALPWGAVIAAILWLATEGRKYWNRLTPDERQELLGLVKKSKGKRSNLSKQEQNRVIELLRKIASESGAESKKDG